MPLPAGEEDACNPERLTALVRSRDPAALDRLTRCYAERLLAAGRRHCRTADEARDAVQDALLVATTRLDSFRGDGSLEGWLVRVVASACGRLRRGAKNDPERHDPDVELAAPAASPEDDAARREVGERLQEALLALGPEDRLVVLLAEVDGFDAPEIAARLGVTPGAVRTRLSRLRGRLREALLPLVTE